jgi:hypothetical protein
LLPEFLPQKPLNRTDLNFYNLWWDTTRAVTQYAFSENDQQTNNWLIQDPSPDYFIGPLVCQPLLEVISKRQVRLKSKAQDAEGVMCNI